VIAPIPATPAPSTERVAGGRNIEPLAALAFGLLLNITSNAVPPEYTRQSLIFGWPLLFAFWLAYLFNSTLARHSKKKRCFVVLGALLAISGLHICLDLIWRTFHPGLATMVINLLPPAGANTVAVSGAQISIINGRQEPLDYVEQFALPPITDVRTYTAAHLEVIGRGDNYVTLEATQVPVGESVHAVVSFARPEMIQSPAMWGKQYGYYGVPHISVIRSIIGSEKTADDRH
jgi:hypothetical protein